MRTYLDQDPSLWPEIWQAAFRIIEKSIAPRLIKAWIEPLNFIRCESIPGGHKIVFETDQEFLISWVKDHYLKQLEEAFTQVTGQQSVIDFILTKENTPASIPKEKPPFTNQTSSNSSLHEPLLPAEKNYFSPLSKYSASIASGDLSPLSSNEPYSPGPTVSMGSSKENQKAQLNPRYLFSSFVVGASNQFAHASAIAVANNPARQYNPLFIYSPPGLGKTHILHAIGNHVLSKNPQAKVTYLSAEQFINELVEAIQTAKMPQFRARFRDQSDILLIDDIQFISGKSKTEEEFFHTFNVLHSSNRQIVLTSDRPPKEIELEERLRTRFEWGLTVDISPPEIETRIAILRAKAERDDIYLPDEVATFLATHIKSNVRELEGMLVKLQAQASLTGAEIALDIAKKVLKNANPEENNHYTVESILNAIMKYYQLKQQDLKSNSRAQKVSLPRQIGFYLIRKYTDLTDTQIGTYFGGKDRTTVLHGIKKIETSLDSDAMLREAVESIQNLL